MVESFDVTGRMIQFGDVVGCLLYQSGECCFGVIRKVRLKSQGRHQSLEGPDRLYFVGPLSIDLWTNDGIGGAERCKQLPYDDFSRFDLVFPVDICFPKQLEIMSSLDGYKRESLWVDRRGFFSRFMDGLLCRVKERRITSL
jgi:hypothetical protein